MIIQSEEPVLYRRMHRLVNRQRGPARVHDCSRCLVRKAHVWAQVHTETGLDPWADYLPLCKSCHCIYDQVNIGAVRSPEVRARISATKLAHPYVMTASERAQVGARFRGVPKTPEQRARISAAKTGVRHSAETRQRMSEVARITQAHRRRDGQGRFSS